MATWDSGRIDQLVRKAAPGTPLGTDEEVASLLRQLAVAVINEQPVPRARFRGVVARWRRLLIAPVAVGAVALTAAAGYVVWYDSDSQAFQRAVSEHTAELTLPPGTDRAAYVAQLRQQGLDKRVGVDDLSVRSMASYYAVCTWLTAWDRRHAAEDRPGEADAVTALRRAIDAPAMTGTDGGGVVANLRQVVDAAAHGDRAPVTRELGLNCAGLPLDGIR